MANVTGRRVVRAGFIPLVDAAPLIVAATQGFAEASGIELVLQRETSWANIRDRVAVGHLDVAHMLAPMPIAQNLGLGPLPAAMIAPMALGGGVNTFTVSRRLHAEVMSICGDASSVSDRAGAVARLLSSQAGGSSRSLTFGIVHTHSMHYYELAYWLASAGLVPQRDYALSVLPPSLMADALASGQIDGFCVGEPWGSVAVTRGSGTILVTKRDIWAGGPEKVLGTREEWAKSNPDVLGDLMRALYRACVWCDDPDNIAQLAMLLAAPNHLDQPAVAIEPALRRRNADEASRDLRFADRAATFPWVSHALWIYAQMVRFGQIGWSDNHISTVSTTFRPDLYRSAIAPLGVPVPSSRSKIEGAFSTSTPIPAANGMLSIGPDEFFDGRRFDSDAMAQYVEDGAKQLRAIRPA